LQRLKMLQRLRSPLSVISVFIFAGCATVPPVISPKPPTATTGGFYHRVEKGETLWRIAKANNLDLEELLRANHITDSGKVEVGRLLSIPAFARQPALSVTFAQEDFIWPLEGRVIANFGENINNAVNQGINILPDKNYNVAASRSGKVVFYNDNFLDLGKTIILEHPDGFWTVYARNQEVFVKTGDLVPRGTNIAKAGQAGRDRKVYLHFEIRKNHIPQNPNFYLP